MTNSVSLVFCFMPVCKSLQEKSVGDEQNAEPRNLIFRRALLREWKECANPHECAGCATPEDAQPTWACGLMLALANDHGRLSPTRG